MNSGIPVRCSQTVEKLARSAASLASSQETRSSRKMFSLRNSSSTSLSGTDEDSFGWWIGVEAHSRETPSSSPRTDTTPSSDSASSLAGDCYALARNDDDEEADDEDAELAERVGLRRLRAASCEEGGREALCYTPERLVRCEDYRILAPSPRLCPSLSDVAAVMRLERGRRRSLEQESRRRSARPVAQRRIVVDYGSCYELKSRLEDECSQRQGDYASDGRAEETHRALEDGNGNSLWTNESTRPHDEPSSRATAAAHNYRVDSEKTLEISEIMPILSDPSSDQSRAQGQVLEGEFPSASQFCRDCLARSDPMALERNDDATTKKSTKPDGALKLLRGKVEKLQCSNKDLYEELSSLRRDFKREEWKINHLSDKINKLRNEVYELRYLDDLLKLLEGELERISKRNWPFVIGHTVQGIEEINLVV